MLYVFTNSSFALMLEYRNRSSFSCALRFTALRLIVMIDHDCHVSFRMMWSMYSAMPEATETSELRQ